MGYAINLTVLTQVLSYAATCATLGVYLPILGQSDLFQGTGKPEQFSLMLLLPDSEK